MYKWCICFIYDWITEMTDKTNEEALFKSFQNI